MSKIKPRMLISLERGMSMTALDWFYDFNVMLLEFSDSARNRLCSGCYWYFN